MNDVRLLITFIAFLISFNLFGQTKTFHSHSSNRSRGLIFSFNEPDGWINREGSQEHILRTWLDGLSTLMVSVHEPSAGMDYSSNLLSRVDYEELIKGIESVSDVTDYEMKTFGNNNGMLYSTTFNFEGVKRYSTVWVTFFESGHQFNINLTTRYSHTSHNLKKSILFGMLNSISFN
jgi:hypothetical protein